MPETRSAKRRKTDLNDVPKLKKERSHKSAPEYFEYLPLSPDTPTIRILQIFPTDPDVAPSSPSAISCSLIHAALTNDLNYDALSYVWGEKSRLRTITLEGKLFKVTKNLWAALRELQKFHGNDDEKKGRRIWIDAICINQDDSKERSEQVRMMGRIFRYFDALPLFWSQGEPFHYAMAREYAKYCPSPTRVIAWLGTADAESKRAIFLIKTLKRHIKDREKTREIIRDPQYLDNFFGLYKLFYREYWWRVWVIQEVALATHTITILCGSDSLLWSDLVEVQEALALHHLHDLDFIAHNRDELSFLRVTIESRGPRALLLPSTDMSSPPDLTQILLKHRFKDSTDPKDRIYSLVGLSNARDDPRFVLDYSRSVRKVYVDVVSYIVSTTKKLDIICAMPCGSNPHGLPSWAPDWSFRGIGSSLLNESFEHQYNASAGIEAQITIFDDKVLSTRGVIIDTVAEVGRLSGMVDLEDELNALQVFFDWYGLFKAKCKEDASSAQRNFARTMLRSKIGPDSELEGLEDPYLWSFGAFVTASRSIGLEVQLEPDYVFSFTHDRSDVLEERLVKETREMTYGRRFIMTKRQLPCLVPDATVKEDLVCVLFGCQLPVILRREEDHYLFIGEAYVDQYSYGRAIDEVKSGQARASEFKIH